MAFPRLVLAISALAVAFIVALSHPGAVAAQGASIPALKQLQALISSQQESAKLANSDPITYAWDLFFYTNWPALTDPNHRGQPDPKKAFGKTGPVVWETWKNGASFRSRCRGISLSYSYRARGIPPFVLLRFQCCSRIRGMHWWRPRTTFRRLAWRWTGNRGSARTCWC